MILRASINLRSGALFLPYIILSAFVSLYSSIYSSDAYEYRLVYENIGSNQVLFYETGRAEVLYYFWNWISSRVGLSFQGFLFFSTLLFLTLKINALHVISSVRGKFRVLTIYTLILFLLHECIQYKIAWAVSIALWACIFISRRRWFLGGFWSLIAAGFHVSVIVLPLFFACAYVFLVKNKRLSVKILPIFFGVIYFLYLNVVEKLINIIDSRYFDYFGEDRLSTQNSSGLFYVYTIGLMGVVLCLSNYIKRDAPKEILVSNFLMYVSVAMLCAFYQYVSMASRLSDVLLIMIIPLMNYVIEYNKKLYLTFSIYFVAFAIFSGRLIVNW